MRKSRIYRSLISTEKPSCPFWRQTAFTPMGHCRTCMGLLESVKWNSFDVPTELLSNATLRMVGDG